MYFSRSAGLWSILGFVMGLGDRHGDNILLDTANGECVFIDFDVIFNKVCMSIYIIYSLYSCRLLDCI